MASLKNRRTIIAMATIAILPLLAACGGSEGGGSAGSVDGSSIVLQTTTGLEPNFQKYAEAYMEEYPDRQVEVRATTDDGAQYSQQLATARISGELPDVFFNVDYLANTLADSNVSLNLVPGIEAGKLGDLQVDDFLEPFVGQYRPIENPEQVHGLPVSADSVALFYNKTIFEETGVTTLPQEDWTWEQMYATAAEIGKKSDGKYIGLAAPLGNGNSQIIFGPVLKAFGAEYYNPENNEVDIGSPEAIEAWTLLTDAYGYASGEYFASPTPPAGRDFDSGNVAMAFSTSANIPATRVALEGMDWDIIPTPEINGNSTAGGGSYGLSISQTTEKKDAAFAFLAWFYDKDQGMELAQEIANVIPPTNEGIDNGAWREVTPPANIGSFAESARSAVLLTQLPGTAGNALIEATVKATQEVELQGKSVEEAFTAAGEAVNAHLDKEEPKD